MPLPPARGILMHLPPMPGVLGEIFYFQSLLVDYQLIPRGVVYGGAHIGELIPIFQAIGFEHVLAIEPNPDAFAELQQFASAKIRCVNAALVQAAGQSILYDVAGAPTLNSLLEPDLPSIYLHLGKSPPAIAQKSVATFALDEVLSNLPGERYNFLYLNIQGGELAALQGAKNSLASFDAILTEVNFVPRYRGCPTYEIVDEYLQARGFRMMRLRKYAWSGGEHGEALYLSIAHLDANKPSRSPEPNSN